jgi:hypothetical protein
MFYNIDPWRLADLGPPAKNWLESLGQVLDI